MSVTQGQGTKSSPAFGRSELFAQLFSRVDEKSWNSAEDRRQAAQGPGSDLPWRAWVAKYFPGITAPFSERHVRLWDWFESLEPGSRPRPRVEPWPRGGAKSSTGELGTVRVGVKLTRRFVLYVSETQDQADKHVQAVASRFEAIGVGRLVGKYGNSKGWRRDQLRTENGFNVAALGLDAGSRGAKLDDFRPDLIIFDDIDGRHDSPATIAKKIETITQTILPAGSPDCACLFLQNLIHKDSIVSQLCDGRADFLMNREAAKVEPAVEGLVFETRQREDGTSYYKITGGTATWPGQSLEICEAQLNDWGRRAFLREAQHRVDEDEDGLWKRDRDIDAHRRTEHPPFSRVCVAIDPNAGSNGDEAGIIVGGAAIENGKLHAWVIADNSTAGGPLAWARDSVTAYNLHHGSVMVAEKNNGGEMVEVTIKTVEGAPNVKLIHASRGKVTRAEPVQKLYEEGRVHHMGTFEKLESELCSWQPGDDSPNRLDALVWMVTELLLTETPQVWFV